MYKTVFIFLLSNLLANAQSKKITLQDFQLMGKVQSVLHTAEKQGDLVTTREKNDSNFLYDDTFQPIFGQYTFNELGNIIEKREQPFFDKKTIYGYDVSNKLVSEIFSSSKIANKGNQSFTKIKYSYKQDTIVYTRTDLDDKIERLIEVTKVYSNNQLAQEYTDQKAFRYFYDDNGSLIKKEGSRKKEDKKSLETYEIKYENGIKVSVFCPENNTLETYYPNGLLKSYKTEFRFQENVYTYDSFGNWITNTVTLDGKPSVKYSRKIDYFE